MMVHIKYQGSSPCGFRQEDFLCFTTGDNGYHRISIAHLETMCELKGAKTQ